MHPTRRTVILLPITALPVIAEPWNPNAFAQSYNQWASLYTLRHKPGGVDATELRAWQEVKRQWHMFSKVIDNEY